MRLSSFFSLGEPRTGRFALLIALTGLGIRLSIAPSLGYEGVDGDLFEHKQAMHLALTEGISEIYRNNPTADPALTGGEWNGGYFSNQPPLVYLLRYLPVTAYRAWAPEGFELWSEKLNFLELAQGDLAARLTRSRGFTVALKLPGIVADLALSLGLFAFSLPRAGRAVALALCAAYALNPGLVLNTAFWGQHDAVAAGLAALACAALHRGRIEAAWAASTLALLTKPQAIAVAPLLLILGVSGFQGPRVARATLAGLAVALLAFLPFLRHGTFVPAVHALWSSTVGGEPFVSCQAANLWWLVAAGEGYEHGDDFAWFGPITPRHLGVLGVLLVNLLLARRLRRTKDPDGRRLFEAAGLAALSFFMLATELHENHMAAALPLLAFGLAGRSRCGFALGALSITFLANLVLFDVALTAPLESALGLREIPVRALSLGVALANTGVWAWLLIAYLRTGERGAASGSGAQGEGRGRA